MDEFDVLIVGGGIGGLMSAYRLRSKCQGISIAVFDKGKEIQKRKCPASGTIACRHCATCSITSGFAGAGAFSDGKLNIGTSYGGTLGYEIGDSTAMQYIHEVESIIDAFTPERSNIKVYSPNGILKSKCIQNNLLLLDMRVKHLGTDNNYAIMTNLISWLKEHNVELYEDSEVVNIQAECKPNHRHVVSVLENGSQHQYYARTIILSSGRSGARFIKQICSDNNVSTSSNAVDIGVRVEMDDTIWDEFSSQIYEPKLLYKTKTFEDYCRTFCFNKGGIVTAENNNGIITANGHSYADTNKRTDKCNFSILSSIEFTEPFNNPTEYAEHCGRMANLIGNGNVIVQRFGDLQRGRRSNDKRLRKNSITPSLKATAGDLSLAMPHRILTNIIETIHALNCVAPGSANDDTLLYGIELKYYSMKPAHNKYFEILDNLYLIGDGSGISRGLSQAGAMGLFVADHIAAGINR